MLAYGFAHAGQARQCLALCSLKGCFALRCFKLGMCSLMPEHRRRASDASLRRMLSLRTVALPLLAPAAAVGIGGKLRGLGVHKSHMGRGESWPEGRGGGGAMPWACRP